MLTMLDCSPFTSRAPSSWYGQRSTCDTNALYSSPKDKDAGIRADQVITLATQKAKLGYPEKLRRVSYFDKERDKRLVFLINHCEITAKTVVDIYKQRWQVELFFKWIKHHLRIKPFYGTSINAVKSQIWVALCIYLLVAIAKKRLGIECSLYTFLQIVEVNLFEKKPISAMVAEALKRNPDPIGRDQLKLFEN